MSTNSYKCLICSSFPLEKSEICELKCKHIYCWKCIENYMSENLKVKMKCPEKDCKTIINDSIVRKVLPNNKIEEYEKLCFPKDSNEIFHCLLPDCGNVVFYTSKEIQFECQTCSLFNCIKCKGIHPFLSCADYQKKKNAVNDAVGQRQLKTMEEDELSRAQKVLDEIKLKLWNSNLHTLESQDIVPNYEAFECSICTKIVPKGKGIQLRKCFHMFCRSCLHDSVKSAENIPINCPADDCIWRLEDREIRNILTADEYKVYNIKCNEIAKGKLKDVYHCKKPDCTFFGIVKYGEYESFCCPVCKSINCLKCNIVHKPPETCEQYQDRIHQGENPDLRSLAYIEAEIKTGSCMKCPACSTIIKKDGGCNWIRCPQCLLELCWILKIPRWGPKGTGDTSGGCKCGVNNKPCDPRCLLGCIPEH